MSEERKTFDVEIVGKSKRLITCYGKDEEDAKANMFDNENYIDEREIDFNMEKVVSVKEVS